MDGITILQTMPGTINIPLIWVCILMSIMGLILIITSIIGMVEREKGLALLVIPAIGLIATVFGLSVSIHNNRLTPENRYYYITIEDNVTMNEFFEHYDLIKHEPNSSLWLVKEKNNQTEEN